MDILSFIDKPCKVSADALVLPVFEDDNFSSECFIDFYNSAKEEYDFNAKYLEILNLPTYKQKEVKNIIFLGLGKKEEYNLNKLRVAASKAFQKAQGIKKVNSVAFAVEGLCDDLSIAAKNVIEGALLGLYKFDKYKTEKSEDKKISKIILVGDDENAIKSGIEKATVICEAVNNARDLINEPAEVITPNRLAEIASGIANLEVKVYGRDEAKEMGMGAFLAVGQGSRHEQKFIHMTYKPQGQAKAKVALVGKGITFDSGGLDIKPAASMLDMKGDMAGSAAVISVMRALTILKPDVEVHGIVAACENMPASRSYKPGDVLTAMNGKTIEVDNTDAEGRLTLADALCFAENLNPDAIIDIATLTGACCVALGKVASGLLGNNDELIEELQISAEEAGEYLWEMPMYDEYFEDLKSDIADFKNSGTRYGGTSAAALFLKKFVKNTPWAHIDIAGTSILNKPLREYQKGVTGVGVRTLINYICNL